MPAENYLARALKAADWFVNTQVLMKKPHWDANHGRLVYTYHMPTRNKVLGLSWTQGRGIITLLQAYEATERPEYLRTAVQAAEYVKHLQILDARSPRRFGAIREEVPASWYVYPRDAMEAGLGLLFLWRITRDEEYLYRSRIFGDWLLSQTREGTGWPTGGFYLDEEEAEQHPYRSIYCIGGGAAFFSNLAKATGEARYMDEGLRPMAEYQVEHFVREDGVILNTPKGEASKGLGHHAAEEARYQGVAVNDDCCGVTMLIAYQELGEQVYLDLSVKYGDWMMACPGPLPNHAAVPLQALTLLDLAELSGEKKYADFARERLAPAFMKGQMLDTGDPAVEGAFRGEDEQPSHYGPADAKREEFVNTRVTAYAANALFKLDGKVFGPYYSALGWEAERVAPPAPELLAPYRL